MASGDALSSSQERLESVHDRIARAAAKAGRAPEEVKLIAISKTHEAGKIRPLIAAGQRVFGENRVQEAQAKWPELQAETPGIELHLVGALQSNKTADAVELFDAIHSIDRPSLVKALAKAFEASPRRPLLFVQVNIGEEEQKGGVAIDGLPDLLARAADAGIEIAGLMCLPPLGVEPAPYFALLARLGLRHGLPALSMGMSGDYETAILCGATHVRIGTALFGERHLA